MKTNIRTLLCCLALRALASCGDGSMDGKLVRAADGKIYKLEWRMGDCYILHEIDSSQLKQIDSLRPAAETPKS